MIEFGTNIGEIMIGLPFVAMAFSHVAREIIKDRAGGVSEISGVNGTQMDAMHLDHTRNENYDNPAYGLYVTVNEHLLYHYVHVGIAEQIGLTEADNNRAIQLISARIAGDRFDNMGGR